MARIWIRSQDRGFLKECNEISLGNVHGHDVIFGVYGEQPNEDMPMILGCYKSKERALQVLDEIQNLIQEYEKDKIYIEHEWEDADTLQTVYEMPAE